jgi:electron transfer flavoprotein beta subunit
MKFHVCIKQVPDVTAPVESGRMVLNAYDATAVEEGLVLREAHGGEVHLVLVGPSTAVETIRKALAMGADSATHLVVEDTRGLDSFAVAVLLQEHFQNTSYELILCGRQGQDSDAALTGPMLAELLQIPYVTNVIGLKREQGHVIATRQGDAAQEIVSLPLPCLVTCSNDMNDPRLPTLRGTMEARKKPIATIIPDHVPQARTATVAMESPAARQRGEMIAGNSVDQHVAALVDRLHQAKAL